MLHETVFRTGRVAIGESTNVWHFCHLHDCLIGSNVNIGQGCYIAGMIGDNCRIGNNVSVWSGVIIEKNVFIAPNVCFTNVKNPRATRKQEYVETRIEEGVTIGANSTILCGITIGKGAMIGAGSVVTKDVPPRQLWFGNPAVWIGNVDEQGNSSVFVRRS